MDQSVDLKFYHRTKAVLPYPPFKAEVIIQNSTLKLIVFFIIYLQSLLNILNKHQLIYFTLWIVSNLINIKF